jgi:hypothetical protein
LKNTSKEGRREVMREGEGEGKVRQVVMDLEVRR